jgi:hypothetical protein
MNRFASVLFAVLIPGRLAAQVGDHPNLVLSIYGGVSSGHSLWNIPRQPLCVIASGACEQNGSSTVDDTLAIARDVTSSVLLGAAVSYFKNPYIGFQAEIFYLGLSFDDRCTPVSPYQPDSESKNQQICNSFASTGASASAVTFLGGVVLRASPRHAISPYLRGSLGFTAYSGGTLQAFGDFGSTDPQSGQPITVSRDIVVDTTPKSASWTVQVAAGFTSRLSPGYQIRFELRDAILPLERLVGPANISGLAPHETQVYHHLALVIGLDVVLEHQRGHRY